MDIDPDSDYETEERKGSSSHRKHCPACECREGAAIPLWRDLENTGPKVCTHNRRQTPKIHRLRRRTENSCSLERLLVSFSGKCDLGLLLNTVKIERKAYEYIMGPFDQLSASRLAGHPFPVNSRLSFGDLVSKHQGLSSPDRAVASGRGLYRGPGWRPLFDYLGVPDILAGPDHF